MWWENRASASFFVVFFCWFVFVLLSAGGKGEDLGSCIHPACGAELFG